MRLRCGWQIPQGKGGIWGNLGSQCNLGKFGDCDWKLEMPEKHKDYDGTYHRKLVCKWGFPAKLDYDTLTVREKGGIWSYQHLQSSTNGSPRRQQHTLSERCSEPTIFPNYLGGFSDRLDDMNGDESNLKCQCLIEEDEHPCATCFAEDTRVCLT